MRKITDFNEFVKVWNVAHNNDKKLTLNQVNRLNKKDFKRYLIYILDDEVHFLKFDTKCPIKTQLSYFESGHEPVITLEYFKEKNMNNLKNRLITHSDKFKPYYSLNYVFDEFNYEVFVVNDTNPTTYENNLAFFESSETFVEFMSDDEVNEYNEIVKDLTLKYNKRLENFYLKHRERIKNVRSDKQ